MRQDLLRRFKQWAGWGIPVAFLPQWDTYVPSLNSLKKRKSLGNRNSSDQARSARWVGGHFGPLNARER